MLKCVVCGESLETLKFHSDDGALLHVGLECAPCRVIAVAEPGSKDEGFLSHVETRYRRKYGVHAV